jgi:predicted hydrocarbon binding protein
MIKQIKTELDINHQYDQRQNRHYINDICTVVHCHHYAVLCTQLADDAKDFEGERLMREAAEDTFYYLLKDYFEQKGLETLSQRISIAEQYWQALGMGLIRFKGVGKYAVTAVMEYSHIDDGWLRKWGGREKPVNFITAGYVAATASLFTGRPTKSFEVNEVQSLVRGDEISKFKAVLR